jgi:hypothetical protein
VIRRQNLVGAVLAERLERLQLVVGHRRLVPLPLAPRCPAACSPYAMSPGVGRSFYKAPRVGTGQTLKQGWEARFGPITGSDLSTAAGRPADPTTPARGRAAVTQGCRRGRRGRAERRRPATGSARCGAAGGPPRRGSRARAQADQTAHEPTDENAHDSKDGRDDKATRIATRHEELGDDADDQRSIR